MQPRIRNLQVIPQSASVGIPERDSLSWNDVRAFLSRYGTSIAAAAVVAVLLGFLYAKSLTPAFVARTLVLIESRLPQALREQLGEATLVLDSPAVESQIAILKSRSIAQSVIAKLGLTPQDNPFYKDEPGRLAWLKSKLGLGGLVSANPGADPANDRLIEAFQNHLDVRRNGLSYVLEIGFRSTDAAKAASIVNAIADVYLTDQIGQKVDAVKQAMEWRDEQIGKIRNLMNRSSRAVQEFKARRDYRILPAESTAAGPDGKSGSATSGAELDHKEPTTLEELEVTAQAYRKVYESNLQVHADLAQRQFLQFTNARVISRAAVPARPEFPRTGLIIALAGLAGIILASSASLVHAAIDDKVSSRRTVESMTGLSCLTEIAIAGRPGGSSWLEHLPWSQDHAPPRVSYIDIARLHAQIEQRFPRGARRTVVVAPANGMSIAAVIANRLAEHYRSNGEATVLITDAAAAEQHDAPRDVGGISLRAADQNEAATDMMCLPAAMIDGAPGFRESEVVALLKPYQTVVVLMSPQAGDSRLQTLMRETPVHIIVAERRVSSRDDIRSVASILSANAKQPPFVVLVGSSIT